ncbi:MAG: thiamine-phosphate kinase [Planctomycetota bacterium]|jgi:thiamine-monophosphate kinase
MSEDAIIEWFARQSKLSETDFPIGIGDDMAQVRLGKDASVLITTDMLIEGVHFQLENATLEQVGYKAIAVSISDCAAMATLPLAAVVSVAMPKDFGQEELKRIHSGITATCMKYNCELVGGDITSWKSKEPFVISVAMLSRPAGCKPVKRSGGKAGDCICVSGQLGGSDKGRHLEFEPRHIEAMKITSMVNVHSMIDISDGLSSDLKRICAASGTGAIIEAAKIPVSEPAKKKEEPLNAALNDGEDFELLFTLSEEDCKILLKHWKMKTPLTCIGNMNDSGKMQIKMSDGEIKDLQAGGYDHLR